MARKDLFRKIRPTPGAPVTGDLIARLQDNVGEAVNTLTGDDDMLRAPIARLVASGAIPAGAAVAVFSGGPGCTVTLPPAASQGVNVASIVMFINRSATVNVAIKPSPGEQVNGGTSMTVGTTSLVTFVSDGVSAWFIG